MKIYKRITIVADILVDEDFDTNFLCICEDKADQINMDAPDVFVGESSNFEVLDYISQDIIELDINPLNTIKENAEEMENKKNV